MPFVVTTQDPYGDPIDGIEEVYGPFDTEYEADEFCDEKLPNMATTIHKLEDPNGIK